MRPRLPSEPRGFDDPAAVRAAELAAERERARLSKLSAEKEIRDRTAELDEREAELERERRRLEREAPRTSPPPRQLEQDPPAPRSRAAALRFELRDWDKATKFVIAVTALAGLVIGVLNLKDKAEGKKVDGVDAKANVAVTGIQGDADAGVPGLASDVAALQASERRFHSVEVRCQRDRWLQQVMAQQKPPVIFEVVGCPPAFDPVKLAPVQALPGRPPSKALVVDRPLPAPSASP